MADQLRLAPSIQLLADRPELIPAVGALRWREWGPDPEPEDPAWWEAVTRQEADRDGLPITFVAVDDQDQPVGVVGSGEYDIEERDDASRGWPPNPPPGSTSGAAGGRMRPSVAFRTAS